MFSFKNPVDDFYLKYLKTEHILVEVYVVRGSGLGKETVKVGESKLPLSPLLEPGHAGIQVQKIDAGDENGAYMGSIKFRTQMRRSLRPALERLEKAERIGADRATTGRVAVGSGQKMVFRVQVHSCRDLRRDDPKFDARTMLPFFSYDFYRFTDNSAVLSGASPEFKYSKAFEVENTRDLSDYMNRQTLVISFLDKSVEFDEAGGDLDNLKDYIGSARIPLNALMDGQPYSDGTMPIRNHLAKQMGTCSVTLTFMP